jgi:hypothetical protein
VSARVPLELVPVGARVTIYGRDGELDIDDATGEVLAQGTDPRFLNFPRTLVSNGACYRHGLYLAEVIDAPAPQQPRGEEGCDAHLTAEDGTERRCYLAAGHSGSHDDDPRDAEIARLRADLAYQDRQQALRDAATGKVAGHAEQCGCHGCVTGPLRVENERLRAALLRYGRHEMQCRFWAEPGCTCGLAEALKETKQP